MEPKCVSLNQVVQEFISKGDATNPWIEAVDKIWCWDSGTPVSKPQPIITEDAEVVSIETIIK